MKYINKTLFISTLLLCSVTTFAQKYKVSAVEHQRITIDNTLDAPNADADAFMAPYKAKVDSVMAPVVGHCARDMQSNAPESEMPNLLADILVWSAETQFKEKVDFGLYNIGGIRAVFSKGAVTYGDVVDVAPFENKICFMTLKGNAVTELFQQIAKRFGEGLSHSVRLVITKDGKLKSATINGKAIDPEADYRIATIDYLIEGNDGMSALKKGTDIVAPKDKKNDTRFIIMDYFRAFEAEGKAVDSQIEGRVKIEE